MHQGLLREARAWAWPVVGTPRLNDQIVRELADETRKHCCCCFASMTCCSSFRVNRFVWNLLLSPASESSCNLQRYARSRLLYSFPPLAGRAPTKHWWMVCHATITIRLNQCTHACPMVSPCMTMYSSGWYEIRRLFFSPTRKVQLKHHILVHTPGFFFILGSIKESPMSLIRPHVHPRIV